MTFNDRRMCVYDNYQTRTQGYRLFFDIVSLAIKYLKSLPCYVPLRSNESFGALDAPVFVRPRRIPPSTARHKVQMKKINKNKSLVITIEI